MHRSYQRRLHGSLNYLPVTVVFALVVLGSIYFLFVTAHTELAPAGGSGRHPVAIDLGAERDAAAAPALFAREVYEIFFHHPETEHVFQIDMPGQSISGMALKPWDQRTQTTNELQPVVQQELSKIAGVAVVAFQPPPLPGSDRPADSVRHRHHRAVRAAQRHRAEIPAARRRRAASSSSSTAT